MSASDESLPHRRPQTLYDAGREPRPVTTPPSPDREPVFPMRVVTRMTGLSADVVRAWERRYGAIEPGRTDGNARRYSHADIARLTRLRDAVSQGHSIGEVSRLSNEALDALADRQRELERPAGTTIGDMRDRYLEAISRFDLPAADAMLSRAAQLSGPRETALDVVLPLMREVGDRWHRKDLSVAEEHAATAQMRALLATLLRTTTLPAGAPRIVAGAPEGHHHEIGAMVAALLAAERGVLPLYLGPNVPFRELGVAAKAGRADVVVVSLARGPADAAEARRERRELTRLCAEVEVWVGCPPGHPAAKAEGVRAFHDFAPFEAALAHRFYRAEAG